MCLLNLIETANLITSSKYSSLDNSRKCSIESTGTSRYEDHFLKTNLIILKTIMPYLQIPVMKMESRRGSFCKTRWRSMQRINKSVNQTMITKWTTYIMTIHRKRLHYTRISIEKCDRKILFTWRRSIKWCLLLKKLAKSWLSTLYITTGKEA